MSVTVIIPTYNRADKLLEAIKSVLNQSVEADEVIVVDDGSTDNTGDLFPIEGVTYYKIEHSGYPGLVRNYGAKKSSSKYLAFLDSDDIWHGDKLEKQFSYLKGHPECRILHSREKWLMNSKVVSQKKRKHNKCGDIFKDSLKGCIMGPSTIIMERTLFNEFSGFPQDVEICEDYHLWLRICNSVNIHYIDDELITKIAGHGDQLSFKYGYIEPFKIGVLEDLIVNFNFSETNRVLAIESLKEKYEIIINGLLKKEKLAEANRYREEMNKFLSNRLTERGHNG